MFKNKKWTYMIYSIVIILLFLAWSYSPRTFNDYPWHIKAGEWMFQNKEILTHNIFSYFISEDTFWFSHEWLAEIFMYGCLQIFKIDYIFLVICIISVLSCLMYFIKDDLKKKDLLSTIFISALIIFSFSTSLYSRPFMFSFLFWIITIKALDNIKRNKNSKLYSILPLITILWTNMHGGTAFFAVLAPLGYFICGKFRFISKRFYSYKSTKKQEKKYLYAFIGNFIGSLINPFTYKIYLYPFTINNSSMKDGISEFAPASISWPSAMIIIILVTIFFIVTTKKINFTDISLIGSFILLTLIYGRFYSWLALASIIILVKYLPNKKNEKFLMEFNFIIYMYLFAVIIFLGYNIYSKPFPEVKYNMNQKVIEELKKIDYENLYNSYDSGAMLNYYGEKCFVNSIAELYDEDTLNIGKKLKYLNMDIYEVEAHDLYNFDAYLIEKDSMLYRYLINNPEKYELIYEDTEEDEENFIHTYAIFKKSK